MSFFEDVEALLRKWSGNCVEEEEIEAFEEIKFLAECEERRVERAAANKVMIANFQDEIKAMMGPDMREEVTVSLKETSDRYESVGGAEDDEMDTGDGSCTECGSPHNNADGGVNGSGLCQGCFN